MVLAKLAEEDPTFTVRTDEQSGQTIISGMGGNAGSQTQSILVRQIATDKVDFRRDWKSL